MKATLVLLLFSIIFASCIAGLQEKGKNVDKHWIVVEAHPYSWDMNIQQYLCDHFDFRGR